MVALELLVLRFERTPPFFGRRQRDLHLGTCGLLLLAFVVSAANLLVGAVHTGVQRLHPCLGFGGLGLRVVPGAFEAGKLLVDALNLVAADDDLLMQPLPPVAVPLHAALEVAGLLAQHVDFFLHFLCLAFGVEHAVAQVGEVALQLGQPAIERGDLFAQLAQLALA